MSDLPERVAALQKRILDEQYYPHLWANTLDALNMTAEKVERHEYGDHGLIMLCHYMWEALPDSPRIRTGPFFDLCSIAELIFGFDAE